VSTIVKNLCGEKQVITVESPMEEGGGMSERIGRNRLPDPEASEFEEEAGFGEYRLVRSWSGVPGLVAVLLSGGILFLAWLGLWERNHPAAAAARGVRSAEPAGRLKAIRELEHIGAEDTEVAIPALIVALSDSDAEVRAAAALTLVTVINGAVRTDSDGDDIRAAVTALLGSQKDPDAAVRSATAQALWMIVITWQGPLGVLDLGMIDEALEHFAADPDAGVRHAAICGLGVIGPRISDEAPPGLIVALEDESPRNRTTAAEYLSRFPREVTRMIPSLVKSMERARLPFRAAYAEILGQIRPPLFSADAIPALVAALRSPDAEVRCLAAASLAEFRDAAGEAVPALLAILRGPDETGPARPATSRDPVISAVEALGRVAPGRSHAEEAVAAVVKVLRSGDARRRAAAAAALGGFRRDDALIDALAESIRDRDVAVRIASLRALKDIGLNSPFPAPKALAGVLDDESPDVRVSAASTLAHVGLGIDPFIPALVRHAEQDPNPQAREACQIALQDLMPPAVTEVVIPDLTAALASRDPRVRGAVAVVLGRLGPSARAAIPALIRVLRSPVDEGSTPTTRFVAGPRYWTAPTLGTPPKRSQNAWADQQYWTVQALGRIAPRGAMAGESVAALMELLKPEETDLSSAVLTALGDFGPLAAPAGPRILETLRQAVTAQRAWLAVWTAAALGRIAPDAPSSAEAIAVLVGFLRPAPGDDLLRSKAAEALGDFGPAAVSAVSGLIELLLRGPSPGRATVAKALGRIAPATSKEDQAVAALTEFLQAEPDSHSTPEAIEAIARFGTKAVSAIPRLKEFAQAPNTKLSSAAQTALATLKVAH
jgi:HEAT repeat protein